MSSHPNRNPTATILVSSDFLMKVSRQIERWVCNTSLAPLLNTYWKISLSSKFLKHQPHIFFTFLFLTSLHPPSLSLTFLLPLLLLFFLPKIVPFMSLSLSKVEQVALFCILQLHLYFLSRFSEERLFSGCTINRRWERERDGKLLIIFLFLCLYSFCLKLHKGRGH